jgi:hypothetical protein
MAAVSKGRLVAWLTSCEISTDTPGRVHLGNGLIIWRRPSFDPEVRMASGKELSN